MPRVIIGDGGAGKVAFLGDILIEGDAPAAPVESTPPSDVTVAENESWSMTSLWTPATGLTYQWQESTDGTTWADIPGATNTTLNGTGDVADTGYQYRCVATDVFLQSTNGAAATLTVTAQDKFVEFPDSGTFVPPPGVFQVRVSCVGGGGGAGGGATIFNTGSPGVSRYITCGGSGGAAGEQFTDFVVSVTPGNSYQVVIGTGGAGGVGGNGGFSNGSNGSAGTNTTFGGSLVVARGGKPGAGGQQAISSNPAWSWVYGPPGAPGWAAAGGSDGSNGGGDGGSRKGDFPENFIDGQPETSIAVPAVSVGGTNSDFGTPYTSTSTGSGGGGSSTWGTGGDGKQGSFTQPAGTVNGNPGTGQGAGGGGGASNYNYNTPNFPGGTGGAGSKGFLRVEWD